MPFDRPVMVVIDTNVLFEGHTKQGGAAGYVVEAWLAGLLAGREKARPETGLTPEAVKVLKRRMAQRKHPP